MARIIPHVAWDILTVGPPDTAQTITVESPAWFSWLETATTFTFVCATGSFTARRERSSSGRGGWYWRAYRHRAGGLKRAYLGKAAELTLAHLQATAATLADAAPTTEAHLSSPPPSTARAAAPTAFSTPLLTTKLAVPQRSARLLSRPRLLAQLDNQLLAAITLVVAPAGFGKTTLVSDWLASRTASDTQVAWLALETADNDPTTFLRYLIAALQTHTPAIGLIALQLLQSPRPPAVDGLMTLLLNDLAALSRQLLLVLDDYHVITAPAIHQALTFLIDHLPPRFHLVIVTREDPPLPLARLRARGQLAEIRANALRFTDAETAVFLTETMGLPLAPGDVQALEERTEGWIAGLQLASIALRDRADTRSFIAAFTGSHRFIVDYLAEEVLARLPSDLQSFLLQTAILDQLSGPLCDAVLGVTGGELEGTRSAIDSRVTRHSALLTQASSSQQTLTELERMNLFLVALDDDRRWYRYHHLFADVLRARLASGASSDTVAHLHRRASAWYEQAQLETEAVAHALAAQDWKLAARLFKQAVPAAWYRGEIQTVIGWLNAFPDSVIRTNYDLCITHATTLIFTEQRQRADVRLHDAERAIDDTMPLEQVRSAHGAVAAMRAIVCHARGDLHGLIEYARQARTLLHESEPLYLNARLGSTHQFLISGDADTATERAIIDTLAPQRARGDLLPLVHSFSLLARLYMLQGRLHDAAATYADVVSAMPRPADMPLLVSSTSYYVGMATLLYERNELASAADHVAHAMALIRGPVVLEAETLLLGYLALARVQQARGEGWDARATLEELAALLQRHTVAARVLRRAAAARAALALSQGEYARAAAWAASCELSLDDQPAFIYEAEYLTLARVQIAQQSDATTADRLQKARVVLDRLLVAAEAGGRVGSCIEILIVRALVLDAQADRAEARANLERAVTLAEPAGYIRIFVDAGPPMAKLLRELQHHGRASTYIGKLLSSFPMSAVHELRSEAGAPARPSLPSPAPSLVEPLTAREREVLRLLAAGASNGAIAETLVISLGTAKKHVNNILAKLDVRSRTQAAIWARGHGLIAEQSPS